MVQEGLSDWQLGEAEKFSPSEGEVFVEVTATSDNPSTPSEFPATEGDLGLEATVKDLREALEKSQLKEASLQEQITDLKSDLSAQKELTEWLKTELEQAKKAAIHLAQANSQLTEEINALKQEKKSLPLSRSYKKSYYLSEKQPPKEPEKSVDTSAETSAPMWLLD